MQIADLFGNRLIVSYRANQLFILSCWFATVYKGFVADFSHCSRADLLQGLAIALSGVFPVLGNFLPSNSTFPLSVNILEGNALPTA